VASQTFMDIIGEDLAGKVRTAAREALVDANSWNLTAVDGVKGVWTENGGKVVELSAADQEAFLQAVANTLPTAKEQNPELEGEIDFLRAVAARRATE
jgi:hypothetical protein